MKDKNTKNNLYRLKSMIIQNKYNKKLNQEKSNKNIINIMKESIKNLKEIDLIYTRADIESLKYGNTSYPDTLLKNETLNRYTFFSIILGYLDATIDDLNKKIKYDYNYNNQLLEVISIREIVIKDYKYCSRVSDPKILVDTILCMPCYINFNNCFNEIKDNRYTLKLQLNLIESYVLGYKNEDLYSLYEIYETYINLKQELDKFMIINKTNVDIIRKKKLNNIN